MSGEQDARRGIENILRKRFHGAVNIKGIRFQIIYSLKLALTLCEMRGPTSIRLEGIEDADLLGLHEDNVYIQLKSSSDPWTFGRFVEPFRNFIEVLRVDPNARFRLVLEGPFGRDVDGWLRKGSLPPKDVGRIEKQLAKACAKAGAKVGESALLFGEA